MLLRSTEDHQSSTRAWEIGASEMPLSNATPDEIVAHGEEMKPFNGERSSLRDTVV